jgi:transposase
MLSPVAIKQPQSSPTDFTRTHVLGIDIAKDTLAACLIDGTNRETARVPLDAVQTFENRRRGHRGLLRWMTRQNVSHEMVSVLMEATGVYWEECAHFFHEQGYAVHVVNPARTGRFSSTYRQDGKTDAHDAETIARYGVSMPMRSWEPPDPVCRELRLRDESVSMLTQTKNRLHALRHEAHPCKFVAASLRRQIAFQEREVKRLIAEYAKRVAASPTLGRTQGLLETIPSIGPVIAGTLLTETDNFDAIMCSKQLVTYSGMVPVPWQSGSMDLPRRISKAGNPRLRRAAYLAAVSATRTSSPFAMFYKRLRANGKPPKVAMLALARKILTVAYAIVRSGTPYIPEYVSPTPTR